MPGSKADRVLEDWRSIAQTMRRPEPRRAVAVRSALRFTVGTTVVASLLLAAVIVSQRLPATGPGGPSVVPGDSVPVGGSASHSASAPASPPAVIEAHVVATIPVGGYLTGCSVEPAAVTKGALWVLRGGSVIKIDTNSSQIVAEIPAGLGSSSLQIASSMGAIWVAPGYCDTGSPVAPMMLKRIDPATNEIVASIPFDAPGFLSTSDVGVWVTVGPGPLTTYRIDAATNEPQSGFKVPAAPIGACGKLWTWTGKPDGTGTQTFISRIDPNSGNTARTFTVEAGVGSLYWVGGECWALIAIETPEPVVPSPTYLVRIDPERGFVERSPDLPSAPFELGGSIWLRSTDPTTQTRTIQRIDPRTGDGLGPSWILPKEVGDGGLFYAGGSVWAQSSGPSTIVQLDINTGS